MRLNQLDLSSPVRNLKRPRRQCCSESFSTSAMNSGLVTTAARNTDMRPVMVSTRLDRAIEHMLMWRWAKRSLCHSLMM
ncbi:hypothetical protein D3C81_1468700 [compost metagenome]